MDVVPGAVQLPAEGEAVVGGQRGVEWQGEGDGGGGRRGWGQRGIGGGWEGGGDR